MRKVREIWRRLAFYFRRDRFDRELEIEMRFHLDMKAADQVDAGLTPQDATLRARRKFGNVALLHERSRETWAIRWADELARDVRYSLRMIRKSPVLASVVVLSMGLAIGANTAIFSLVDAVMLRTLSVRNPSELVLFGWSSGPNPAIDYHDGSGTDDPKTGLEIGSSLTYDEFQRMTVANQSLSDLFAFTPIYRDLNLSAGGQAYIATGQYVSGGYYQGLGVNAILGRTITDADDSEGAAPVAVISYDCWKRGFRMDPAVIGETARVNAVAFTIIGVTQPGFQGARDVGATVDVSLPLATESLITGQPADDGVIWISWLRVMGRLKPGTTIARAHANLEPVYQQAAMEAHEAYLAKHPDLRRQEFSTPNLTAVPGGKGEMFARRRYSSQLYLLLVIVGAVLLIACTNTANLLLARSGARSKEMAVRMAVGAGRLRLIRQLLTESVLLSLAGGAAGLILAYWLKDALLNTLPWGNNNGVIDPRLNLTVLTFAAAASIGAGVLFGIAPALKGTRVNPGPALKQSLTIETPGRWGISAGKLLIVAQVALSLALVIGAGLFLRTLRNLQKVDYGFDAHNVLLFRLNPSMKGYKGENLSNVFEQAFDRISSVPGVKSASMSIYPLLSGGEWFDRGLTVPGAKVQPDQHAAIYLYPVRANFLETMHIPLLLGRSLQDSDVANSARVAVIDQSLARLAFGDENPIGRLFSLNDVDDPIPDITVVGVAADTRYDDLRRKPPKLAYLPYTQCLPKLDKYLGGMTLAVKTAADPMSFVFPIRQAIQSIDGNFAISEITTQQNQIDDSAGNERLLANFTTALGLVALLLACLGLYGVMSYNVSRKTNEIGIRMALGASARRLVAQLMLSTMLTVGIGVALGVGGSLVASRLLTATAIGLYSDEGLLFGVTANDPLTIAVSALCLLVVASAAAYLPARRTSRVDPLAAVRYE